VAYLRTQPEETKHLIEFDLVTLGVDHLQPELTILVDDVVNASFEFAALEQMLGSYVY